MLRKYLLAGWLPSAIQTITKGDNKHLTINKQLWKIDTKEEVCYEYVQE